MADEIFDTGRTDPLYTNADLNATGVSELRPTAPPAPVYVSRGNPSYYGFRNGVKVVTVGTPQTLVPPARP